MYRLTFQHTFSIHSSTNTRINDGSDGRVVRTLDPCSKGPWFEITFRPVIQGEERISQLSVIPGKRFKRNHEVWSHREEGPGSKDQGRTARLVYLFSGPFVLST